MSIDKIERCSIDLADSRATENSADNTEYLCRISKRLLENASGQINSERVAPALNQPIFADI